jgi:hypothetical protein
LKYPETPDGRYFVARERLWRKTDPCLPEDERQLWVKRLMEARRAVKDASSDEVRKAARAKVHEAKLALGERGPVWWDDGAPDETRLHPKNSSYAGWWAGVRQD